MSNPPIERLFPIQPPTHEIDWARWELTEEEDDVPESTDQTQGIRTLMSALEVWLEEKGWGHLYVGSDQFFAWMQKRPLVRLSPDVYVFEPPPGERRFKTIQLWEPDHNPPWIGFEFISTSNRSKDHQDSPLKYQHLGAQEQVLFEPEAAHPLGPWPLKVYRRSDDGTWGLVEQNNDRAPVWLETLQAWILISWSPDGPRLRLARDAAGHDLVPTHQERAEKELHARQLAEQARSEAEQARSEAEQALADAQAQHQHEREARNVLERQLAELRALMESVDD
ncbi:MAG: Uma2 family endonuclease [Myxococcota bacterium]